MSDEQGPTKRTKHDFSSTFDVLVGQEPEPVKRLTLHTDLFTQRSGFFAAARKPEWIADDPTKPVDLSVEDPEIFQAYLNCVYVGPTALAQSHDAFRREVLDSTAGVPDISIGNLCKSVTKEQLIDQFQQFGKIEKCKIKSSLSSDSCDASIQFTTAEAGKAAIKACDGLVLDGRDIEVKARILDPETREQHYVRESELADLHYNSFIDLYLLADKLQDAATANMILDGIQRFYQTFRVHPEKGPLSLAYQSTMEGSPLRNLLFDIWFYDTSNTCEKRIDETGFPIDFLHEIVKHYIWTKSNTDLVEGDISCVTNIEQNDIVMGNFDDSISEGCRYHQHDDEHPLCPRSFEGKGSW